MSGNAFEGAGILVFFAGLATIALVTLPYASDRPVSIDRGISYVAIAEAAPDGHHGAVVLVNGYTGMPGSFGRVFTAMKHAADTAYCHS